MNDFEVIEPPTQDLIEEFKYKVKPTQTHKDLLIAIEQYYKENEKFMKKDNSEAGKRARKQLLLIYHLVKQRRGEISQHIYHSEE